MPNGFELHLAAAGGRASSLHLYLATTYYMEPITTTSVDS
jgi:hypothetical protein